MSSETADTPIAIKDLHKAFDGQKVLDGVTLQVVRGETVAVLGRSGGGKSVLLKLLIRLETPDSGSIRIAGQEITRLDEKQLNDVRKKIGFLFQQAALYDSLTVEENVAFPLSRHAKMSNAEQKRRVRELLADVGMDRDLEKLPSQISGGMQKRVGLARALALDPEILLFDEPTAGLDPRARRGLWEVVRGLRQSLGLTVFLTTHYVEEAEPCDRVAVLDRGRLVALDTPAELKRQAAVSSLEEVFLARTGRPLVEACQS